MGDLSQMQKFEIPFKLMEVLNENEGSPSSNYYLINDELLCIYWRRAKWEYEWLPYSKMFV